MQLTSSQQALTLVPNLRYCIFLFCFFFLFSQQVILFLQLFVCAYELDKQQTVQNTYGRNNKTLMEGIKAYVNKHAYKNTPATT
jgi:hypothetical protein